MLVRELLAQGADVISKGRAGETAWLDATILWAACIGQRRQNILASLGEVVPEDLQFPVTHQTPQTCKIDFTLNAPQRFFAACKRRATGYPIAYLTGSKEFFGRDFLVDESVLIPRPETEILVEWVVETLSGTVFRTNSGLMKPIRLHDCCTGSGCIPLSLGLEFISRKAQLITKNDFSLSASDLSESALETARLNQLLIAPEIPINWQLADLLYGFPLNSIDVLTANPPYVPHEEAIGSSPQSWREPVIALDGGADGLDLIRRLVSQASHALSPGAWFFMEFGDGQSSAIIDILESYGFESPEIKCDFSALPRLVRVRQAGA